MMQRKALLVATQHYGNPCNDLNSCNGDSRAFEDLLRTRYGFAPEAIHVLGNEQATPTRMDADLAWLCKNVTADDRLLFYYSEHGYQVRSDEWGKDGVIEEVLVLEDRRCIVTIRYRNTRRTWRLEPYGGL